MFHGAQEKYHGGQLMDYALRLHLRLLLHDKQNIALQRN